MIWQAFLAIAAFLSTPEQDLKLPNGDDTNNTQLALENSDLFGGDMIIPREQWATLGSAIVGEEHRWPGAIIPYVIHESLRVQTNLIENAMKQYHENTCIKFVKRTYERQFVYIFAGQGCSSYVGRNPNQTPVYGQPLSLGPSCYQIGTVLHQLGHVVGFFHEHIRSDRDEYLTIHLRNVMPGQQQKFTKLQPQQNLLINTFDYDSIMIYGEYAFSKSNHVLKTMVAKNGQTLFEPSTKTKMTKSDIERINKLYKCPYKSPPKHDE